MTASFNRAWWWCLLFAGLLVPSAHAWAQPARAQSADRLIDVPYITQTRDLCGGAALEMVFRYWGETSVRAADFAPLVEPGRGIRTGDLATAASTRGWTTRLLADVPADPRERIRDELNASRPLIALIEVAPDTYHYIVIVGATDALVVFHDPARAPFRTESWAEFDRVWRAAGRWMLLVLPSKAESSQVPSRASTPGAEPASPCAALVQRSVEHAGAGALDDAERGLTAARSLCPSEVAPVRELAGLRFVQSRWREAAALAESALALDDTDVNAREILATSLYLYGQTLRALDAWAPAGGPTIDVVSVSGAERTRHPVLVDASSLTPGRKLTATDLARAARRVGAVPAVASADVTYTPDSDGRATVDIRIREREPVPFAPLPVIVGIGRAVISDSVDVPVSGILGEGEHMRLRGRWAEERPLFLASLAVPAPSGIPGVVAVLGSWERQAYAVGSGITRARRHRLELGWSHWLTANVRTRLSLGRERFDDDRANGAGLGVEQRLFSDHVAVQAGVHRWWSEGGVRFHAAALSVSWRSTRDAGMPATAAHVSAAAVSDHAPLAVWPGAGTGASRRDMLRAHPLLRDDVVSGDAFGRTLVQATVERTHPLRMVPVGQVSGAVFVDAARVWRPLVPGQRPARWLVDAGIGLRVPVGTGIIRLDLAHGLRGGGLAASAGWSVIWPD